MSARSTHGLTLVSRRSGPTWKAYKAWQQMKHRCYNHHNKKFQLYGGRGIRVCDRWLNGDGERSGVECFLSDMGPPPPDKSLDRFPNCDGNYEPVNCRWGTDEEQNGNRGDYNIMIEWEGVKYCCSALARKFKLSHVTLSNRISAGWPLEKALTIRPNKHNRITA